ncbi:MAG: hypothetical protein MK226_15820 [Saprospiraceae bacterium]|jgi:hypothetical protein|nr:hypothetical protein [Saprospiraceae bacterium]
MTQNKQHHLNTLSEIRSLMERSSRFISLSGLSGVVAGTIALLGAIVAYIYLEIIPFDQERIYYVEAPLATKWGLNFIQFFFLDALAVLLTALSAGIFFTTRKAKQQGLKVWDATSKRLLINLLIPLITGGVFCLALLYHRLLGFVAPTTLIFYGLALVNASKFTLNDIRYLGISEIILGLIALFYLGYGLEFWAIGFGILHIFYGAIMYFKYERKEAVTF